MRETLLNHDQSIRDCFLAAHPAFGKTALNYLLSVLAQIGQTPNTVFAQEHGCVPW
jgi:hypothetical protein